MFNFIWKFAVGLISLLVSTYLLIIVGAMVIIVYLALTGGL